MAVTTKVIRVANPRRRAGRGAFRLRTARRKNAAKRRKLSPKQIRIFGTPAQKAALKRRRKAKSHTPARRRRKSNPGRRPKTRVIYRTKRAAPKRRRRRANPGLVVTLGSVNPRRRSSVAATKKRKRKSVRRRRATNARHHRAAPVRRRRRRRTNARKVYVVNPRRRRRNTRRRRVVHNRRTRRMNSRRRRNPALFGRSNPKDLVKLVGGGLAGVWATKIAASYLSPMVSSFGSVGGFMPVLVSGVSAWLLGFAVGKIDKEIGEAVMFGGFMQAGSIALNSFIPSIGGQISLGDLVNGNFVVPQNPIMAGNPMSMSAPAARGMSAYGPAY